MWVGGWVSPNRAGGGFPPPLSPASTTKQWPGLAGTLGGGERATSNIRAVRETLPAAVKHQRRWYSCSGQAAAGPNGTVFGGGGGHL